MNERKPRLFITPEVIKGRSITEQDVHSLRERFDVSTVGKHALTRAEFLAYCENQDAILAIASDVIDEEVVKAAGGRLKMVSLAAAGYDRLDTDVMKKYGIRVGLTGSVLSNATAELAVTLALSASRQLTHCMRDYSRCFSQEDGILSAGLEDCTVGIIGAGRIGQSVAMKMKPFLIKRLLYYSRSEKDEMKKLVGELRSLEDIARESDYIIISLAYNARTHKIIDQKLLNLMKPTTIIVNVGRGGEYFQVTDADLIDQEALVQVLQKKGIGGAALDVTTPEPLPFDHPLLHLENAVVTPHCGGLTYPAGRKAKDMAIKNIIAFFNNEEMPEELIL